MAEVSLAERRIAEHQSLYGTLFVWPSGALFKGGDMLNSPHRHFTASIIVGMSGPFRLRAEPSSDWVPMDAVMVAPNLDQQLDARGTEVAILQVDPESRAYARIAHHFADDDVRSLGEPILSRLRTILARAEDPATAKDAYQGTLDELAAGGTPSPPIDPRIRKVLGIIKSDFLSTPPAAKLAAAVGLSSGRLIHLFTREMGLPIRRYILWLRLRDVLISVAAGATLTQAAHHAGFSDSAHLSRTFRGMFGFPPSSIGESRARIRIVVAADGLEDTDSPHPPIDEGRRVNLETSAKMADEP